MVLALLAVTVAIVIGVVCYKKSRPFPSLAGADYAAINTTFLSSYTEKECVIVQTFEDTLVEDNEKFILSAKFDETLPVSFNSTAEITIVDNDGEDK